MLTVKRHANVDAFLADAGRFLGEREAEHNLLLGICTNLQRHAEAFADRPLPVFLTVIDGAGGVVGASLRTPPFNQVLSEMDEDAARLVAATLADAHEELPGLLGPMKAAQAFVATWEARSGQRARINRRERIFRCTRIVPPRPAPGTWRRIDERDRDILGPWYVAFHDEALPEDPPLDDLDAMVERWLAGTIRTFYVWEAGGDRVCLVGAGGETPGGTRIGPVYTPPEHRGRGYASNLTAAVTQAMFDAGRTFCFLFTDLANPTSNKIYQAIGYEPVTDVDEYAFRRA